MPPRLLRRPFKGFERRKKKRKALASTAPRRDNRERERETEREREREREIVQHLRQEISAVGVLQGHVLFSLVERRAPRTSGRKSHPQDKREPQVLATTPKPKPESKVDVKKPQRT